MPHVVIEGAVDLASWVETFEPLVVRKGGDVLRADSAYLEREGRTALVEALAIEAGRKLPFYVKISVHDRGTTTVRVDPLTHPERSEGVREIVGRLGLDLLQRTEGAKLGKTNLVLPFPPSESRDTE
jgi:hypothetical protein